MNWLIEQFFGRWECVVTHLVPNKAQWLIICHRHTVTGRVKGYVDMGKGPFYELEEPLVRQHIKKYRRSSDAQA